VDEAREECEIFPLALLSRGLMKGITEEKMCLYQRLKNVVMSCLIVPNKSDDLSSSVNLFISCDNMLQQNTEIGEYNEIFEFSRR
jgi:hypothetical protein